MSTYENKIYISYAWKGESENLVNKIDESLQKRGVFIVRDKRDLGFKGSIKEFMELIGKGLCVIVVISDKYLKSPNCMFELVEIAKNKQFHTRIFPVVLSDANIYDPIQRLEYVKYWEDQRQKLADAMRTVDPANLQGIRDDIDNYTRFRAEISELVSTLKDMNTLTPEIHKDSDFNELFIAIERRFKGEDLASEDISARVNGSQSGEQLLEIITKLPAALFERLVFKFDKSNVVPGRESSQAIRTMELLRLVQSQKGGIITLRAEVQKLTGG